DRSTAGPDSLRDQEDLNAENDEKKNSGAPQSLLVSAQNAAGQPHDEERHNQRPNAVREMNGNLTREKGGHQVSVRKRKVGNGQSASGVSHQSSQEDLHEDPLGSFDATHRKRSEEHTSELQSRVDLVC